MARLFSEELESLLLSLCRSFCRFVFLSYLVIRIVHGNEQRIVQLSRSMPVRAEFAHEQPVLVEHLYAVIVLNEVSGAVSAVGRVTAKVLTLSAT